MTTDSSLNQPAPQMTTNHFVTPQWWIFLFSFMAVFAPALASDRTLPFDHTLTDVKGRQMEASILSASKDALKVRRASDGKIFVLKTSQLSKEDQQLIDEVQQLSASSDTEQASPGNKKAGDVLEITLKSKKAGKMNLRWCPPGEFFMGCCSRLDPQHTSCDAQIPVKLTKGFWIAETEVTQYQWETVMDSNPSKFVGDKLPVHLVNWNDAQSFVNEVNEGGTLPDGWKMALPTVAQWEYACKAGTQTHFNNGENIKPENMEAASKDEYFKSSALDKVAWYQANSEKTVHPVASKEANAWGIYDMHGNVMEHCAEWGANGKRLSAMKTVTYSTRVAGEFVTHHEDGKEYYKRKGRPMDPEKMRPLIDPAGPTSGTHRRSMGGSFTTQPTWCTTGRGISSEPDRDLSSPAARRCLLASGATGFRVILVPAESGAH